MQKLENNLVDIRNQLKQLSNFSEFNATALNDIVDHHGRIIQEQYHNNPIAYTESRTNYISVKELLQLLTRNEIF